MKYIELAQGKRAIVDNEDYKYLSQFKWHLSSNGYAVMTTHNYVDGVRKTYHPAMHSLVNKTPKGKSTDHINENKLDNRRKNLRTCTQSQNMANRGFQKNNKSGYKGVYWSEGKWTAQIRFKGETIHLGRSKDIKEAAQLYSNAASHYFGEFARL
jgi:hypothetical protein